jgi:hypothetical protein
VDPTLDASSRWWADAAIKPFAEFVATPLALGRFSG